jgi:hypothetical protein
MLAGKPKKLFYFCFFAIFQIIFAYGSAVLGDLSGKVIDKSTGKAIPNATIIAVGNGSTFVATTDNTGYFSFIDLQTGTYTLTIEEVGYQTLKISNIPVTANTTFYNNFSLEPIVYHVQGVIVTGIANPTVNPRETVTYYGMTKNNLNELLPGPASLNTNAVLQEMPGVQTYQAVGGYALTLPGGPHVRGGTGLGTIYALDGIPLNNYTLFGDPGNLGLNTGLSSFQFYPGIYPVQYGNGMDGYQNILVPEGFGKLHGSLQFSYGFWLDSGENSPLFSADPTTGVIENVIGTTTIRPSNPDYWNLELSGQAGKFHYFFSTLSKDGGMSGYADPQNEAVITFSGVGGAIYRKVAKDGILKLNYDFDPNNSLEFLYASGFDFQSPEFISFLNNGTQATFEPVPPFNYQSYNIEALEYTHHFSPGQALIFKGWLYNSNPDFYAPSAPDGYFAQNDIAREKAGRLEYENQINDQNKITIGAQYIYTNDTQEMSIMPPNPAAALVGNSDFGGADNQNPSAWFNEEWTPTPNWDINIGVRWDKMIYRVPNVPGILLQPNGLPYANQGFTSFSPDFQINNFNDLQGMFTNCTPQFNICISPQTLSPSFVQPRISASYRLADNMTLKAGYGEFAMFPDDQAVFAVSNLCAPQTGIDFGVPCQIIGNVGYTTGGNIPETGNQYELSFEYLPDSNSFIKITPYYKTVKNPFVYIYIPIAAAGGMINAQSFSAKGVELEIHTQDWHGLTGSLNYTYDDATIVGNPEYAFTLLPQFLINSPVTGAVITQPNALSNASALYNQVLSQPIPADWDVRHTVNLLLHYKASKSWEIAPNFTFMTGQPYGLGSAQLQSLFANLQTTCANLPNPNNTFLNPATCAEDLPANGNFNPLNETIPNSLRSPSFFLANLAITYHANDWLSTTLSIFNLFNNKQILAYNSTPFFPTFMGTFGFPFLTDYSPLKGKYAPLTIQPIRQFFITTTLKF